MTAQQVETPVDDFAVGEWNRLSIISNKYDVRFKGAYLQTVVQGQQNRAILRDVVADAVMETAISTADKYGVGFDPTANRWKTLVEGMTDGFMNVVSNEAAKKQVRSVLPEGLSLSDRSNRLNVFGLSGRDAVRLERMRQEGRSRADVEAARINLSVQRGNIVALTETNRIVNATLESVWLDNTTISKARRKNADWQWDGEMFYEGRQAPKRVTSLRGIPTRARKTIVTRRDNRICNYCLPLEGIESQVGSPFVTQYGSFNYPPFHPRCRCFMIVRL
jgi:hypothetical protein